MTPATPDFHPRKATLATLLSLAWPIIVARATQSVIGFSDALMVAPLGEDALAATTTGSLNAFAIIILPMGTVFIVQSFAAQLRGRGELTSVARYAWYGLGLALVAALLAALAIPAVPWALGQFQYTPPVHALMSQYLAWRMLAMGAAVGSEALGNWYGGLGHTRPAMFAGLLAMVANVFGNYLLIEPRFGLPGFGVAGAAWASVGASWLGFFAIFIPYLRGEGYERSGRTQLYWGELARVLRFGLPNGINWFLEFSAFMLFINGIVAKLGTTTLAALNVVIQINSIAFMPAFGLASAGAILVGEAIGRRSYGEVTQLVRMTAGVTSVWMVSMGLLYIAGPRTWVGWFQAPDATHDRLIEVGASMLVVSALWQLFDALGLTLGEALRAAGDTTWCMTARLLLAWLVFLPTAWLAGGLLDGGAVAVMVVLAGYLALLACTFGVRFASGHWRRIDLIGRGAELA